MWKSSELFGETRIAWRPSVWAEEKKQSTSPDVIEFVENIPTTVDKTHLAVRAFIDLHEAFDTIHLLPSAKIRIIWNERCYKPLCKS